MLMDVQTLYIRLGTIWHAEIICLFRMSNFMFATPFPNTEKLLCAGFCHLMEVFTFPRERHYSLELMSAGTPRPLWEKSLSPRVD
jgi:hypothetical protein